MGFFREIGRRVMSQDNSDFENRGKVLAFINQKGGVGKTTMAYNTAFALSKRGYRVLCIDMDPQSNLSLLFNADAQKNETGQIYQLLINSIRELKALHSPLLCDNAIVKGEVDLIPAGQELAGFDLSVSGIASPRQLILKKFIEKNDLTRRYDFIIIDCPPTLGLLVVNILCASHGILIPFRPDEFSRKGLEHFYEVLADIEDMGITQVPQVLAHIPNLVDNRRKQEEEDLSRITTELAELHQGQAGVVAPFYNRAPLVRAQAQKKSVFEYQSKEFLQLQEQYNDLASIIENWIESDLTSNNQLNLSASDGEKKYRHESGELHS